MSKSNKHEDPDIRLYSFTLTGVSPLLMHADDVEKADELEAWRKNPQNKGVSKAGDDRSPPWTWKAYCYSDGEFLSVPADNIMAALRYAGSQLILKKQKTFKSATQCGLVVREMFCPLEVPAREDEKTGEVLEWRRIKAEEIENIDGPFVEHTRAAKTLGFKLFVKRCPVGTSKHVRVRPKFEKWRISGHLEVGMPEFSEDVLSQLWTIAGSYAGLCDWRPSSPKSPGPHGRFRAELTPIEEVKTKAA